MTPEKTLAFGAEFPFDGRTPANVAHWAALGVLSELDGRSGIDNALGEIEQDTRVEIVDKLTSVISAAYCANPQFEGRAAGSLSEPTTPAFYVASRASNLARPQMWRDIRDNLGVRIISTWIDEALRGGAPALDALWERIVSEIARCDCLVLYVVADDFPLQGAFVEVGMALALSKPVRIVAPRVFVDPDDCRPFGSWAKHPLVKFVATLEDAFLVQG